MAALLKKLFASKACRQPDGFRVNSALEDDSFSIASESTLCLSEDMSEHRLSHRISEETLTGPRESTGSFQPSQANAEADARKTTPAALWSEKHLTLAPYLIKVQCSMQSDLVDSPSPFPMHDHGSAPTLGKGEIYIFGGMVEGVPSNELYRLSTEDDSMSLVQTSGEVPPARYKHAVAIVGSVLIVWGGKCVDDNGDADWLDDGLYLLNIISREWTKIIVQGRIPCGRHGHSACVVGPKFYILGGDSDDGALYGVWAFDLNSLRTKPIWEQVACSQHERLRGLLRIGHTCVVHNKRIIVFGGTDGKYHHNDTWEFDTQTNVWKTLLCIGYIPANRSGHAATLVGDVMYIFGGTGIDGRPFGDTQALNLLQDRWYVLQNMRWPSPSPRSGHTMVTVGDRVYVLGGTNGGQVLNQHDGDSSPTVHILNTGATKYLENGIPTRK